MLSTIGFIHNNERYRMKDREKAQIFQDLAMNPPCSRKTIGERTGIRPTTISRAVQELIADGLVGTVKRGADDRRGRPEILLEINPNRLTAVSMYVQARELRAAVINLREETICEYIQLLSPKTANREFLDACTHSFHEIRSRMPEGSEIIGIAVSLIGTVAAGTGTWISAARWHNIKNLDFSLLSRSLGLPVTINRIHDAELAYILQKNPLYRRKNVLFLHWGFGIGASYAYAGQIIDSTIGRFCEIGHTRISLDHGKECQCGAVGCLETEAALWAIQNEISGSIKGSFTDERALGCAMRDMKIMELPAVRRATRYMMLSILNIHQIFYPDVIVIIGPFTENEEVFHQLEKFLHEQLPDYSKDKVEICSFSGGFQGCIQGSVYGFFNTRLKNLLTLNAKHN